MKIFAIFLTGILISNVAAADSWFCQADCGGVRLVLSVAAEGFVPVYSGGDVEGEGKTIGKAFSDMRSNCNAILHDGFDIYRPGLRIDLDTRVDAQKVCRQF